MPIKGMTLKQAELSKALDRAAAMRRDCARQQETERDQTSYDRWRDAIMDTTPPFEY